MCVPVAAAIIGSAVLGAGASLYSASKSASAQKRAAAQAETSAARQAQQSETAFNKANQKTPDLAYMLDRNKKLASAGVGSTFLTGPAGAPPLANMLGRPALLGA